MEGETLRILRSVFEQNDLWISLDGRVGERDVEQVLKMTEGTLARLRREGKGPEAYRIPGSGGRRITYRLTAVAKWYDERSCSNESE